MANVLKRVNKKGETSYYIRVFIDQKANGEQSIKAMTYKPEPGMTQRQAEKKLNETVIAFEKKVKNGVGAFDGKVKFETYAAQWLQNADLAPKTRETYGFLLKRVNLAIGHLKLESIQPHHLQAFYQNLKEDDVKRSGRHATSSKLAGILAAKAFSRNKLAKMAGLSNSTVGAALKGERVSIEAAQKISAALDAPVNKIFYLNEHTSGLSDKTVLHHHRLISDILGSAKLERIIPHNVAAEFTHAPKVQKKEARYLDDEQAQRLVLLLLAEPDIRVKTAILLALYSGVRRGELCGLSWGDIDEKDCIVHIRRASQYLIRKGVNEVPTKNESSERAIKMPPFIFEILSDYRKWWLEQKLLNGERWQGDKERLFIQDDGKPINPDTINFWLDKFIKEQSLERFTPHSLRHTFITLQIMGGVPIRTLQDLTGHAQASTINNTYAHAIKTANVMAMQVYDNILTPQALKENPDKSMIKK